VIIISMAKQKYWVHKADGKFQSPKNINKNEHYYDVGQ